MQNCTWAFNCVFCLELPKVTFTFWVPSEDLDVSSTPLHKMTLNHVQLRGVSDRMRSDEIRSDQIYQCSRYQMENSMMICENRERVCIGSIRVHHVLYIHYISTYTFLGLLVYVLEYVRLVWCGEGRWREKPVLGYFQDNRTSKHVLLTGTKSSMNWSSVPAQFGSLSRIDLAYTRSAAPIPTSWSERRFQPFFSPSVATG